MGFIPFVPTAGNITLPLPVADGGTGAATAAAALTSLGALPAAGGTVTGALTVNAGSFTAAPNIASFLNGTVDITGGYGLAIAEPANGKQGVATLNGITAVVISNTSITASSRIFITINNPGGAPGSPYVSARSAGVSFSIKSTSATDSSDVAYLITEPG